MHNCKHKSMGLLVGTHLTALLDQYLAFGMSVHRAKSQVRHRAGKRLAEAAGLSSEPRLWIYKW